MNIKKYFWSLNPKALKEVKLVLKNPNNSQYVERMFTLLSRCDNPKEVFSVVDKQQFIKTWPRVRRYWVKTGQAADFRAWWETVYEELLKGKKEKPPLGKPSEIFLKIGRIIREKRLKRKISQSDLARLVGMTQPDISAIEAGRKNITLETLIRLCKTLNIKSLPF